jgi:uncharacterized integral membrane protein
MSTPSDQKGPSESRPASRRSSGEMLRTGGLIALAVVATVFAVLNLEEVKVDWIIGSGHAPLIIVIAISVLAGIVLAYGADRVNRKRR